MRSLFASLVIPLAIGSFHGSAPGTTHPVPEPQCETIDLYFFEGMEAEGYFDFANWTTADRRFGYLGDLAEHHLTMTPGAIEFYVEIYGPDGGTAWQLGEWQYLPGCSRAALYLKVVGGQPVLRVRVFPPRLSRPALTPPATATGATPARGEATLWKRSGCSTSEAGCSSRRSRSR